jgi:prepilin-type N-terminal cleavage/methylation domain-containing protein
MVPRQISAVNRGRGGFTLAEVLAALLLMAIVIPVAMQGMGIATRAGEVSQRKAMAARIGEKVLNETIVTGQLNQSLQSGVEQQGPCQFRWTIRNEPWNQLASVPVLNSPNGINQGVVNQNNIHELSVDVTFPAQGRDYAVHLSTLVNISQQ